MIDFFKIDNHLIELGSYGLSYLEFIGVLFGLICVWLAARANRQTWTTSLISAISFLFLFYQISLYSDMFLQVFFCITSIFGWFMWKKKKEDVPITSFQSRQRVMLLVVVAVISMVLAQQIQTIHVYYSEWFPKPASFPVADAYTTVMSIFATFFLMKKKLEAWILWIIVDVISIWVYYHKGVWFVAAEYFLFLLMACYGLYRWNKEFKIKI